MTDCYIINGERLMLWRIADNIYIHTNGRALAISPEQAEAMHAGLGHILRGDTDRCATSDMVTSQSKFSNTSNLEIREHEARGRTPAKYRGKPDDCIPTLEDI